MYRLGGCRHSAAVPPRPWLQVVTFEVGLSKLSSVTGPCVQCVHAGRTQSNLLILIRLSAAGDCEALRGTLDNGDTPCYSLDELQSIDGPTLSCGRPAREEVPEREGEDRRG